MRSRTRRPHVLSPIAWAVLALAVTGLMSLTATLQLFLVQVAG